MRQNNALYIKKMRPHKIDVKVSIIGPGGVLGLEDMTSLTGSKCYGLKHHSTVRCISEKAQLYFLSVEDFYGSFYRHIKKVNLVNQLEIRLPFYN